MACCTRPSSGSVVLGKGNGHVGAWPVFASFVLGLWVSFWVLWEIFGMVAYGRPACGLRLVGRHVGALVGIRYVVFDKRMGPCTPTGWIGKVAGYMGV